jgi:hypothetical protein
MVVFEEPGDEFELEKVKKKNFATKVRTISFLIIFLLVIFFIAKNDFSFAFGEKDVFEQVCGPANTRNSAEDEDLGLQKAKKAIESNKGKFKDLPGFQNIFAKKEPMGYKQKEVSMVMISFDVEDNKHKIIPKELCGFQTRVIYK